MGTKRLFVAIDISEDARKQAADYITGLKAEFRDIRVGWEEPEKLHLTLKFIGTFEMGRMNELKTLVGSVASRFRPFDVVVEGTGAFTKSRRQQILWLGVRSGSDKGKEFRNLGRMLNERCAELGVEYSSRELKPHLTIGRVKKPDEAGRLIERHLASGFKMVEFEASGLYIYESMLKPTGSVYSVLSYHPFGE